MKVLGVETSCDDTGVAIYDTGSHTVEHILYSQVAIHTKYGGIVPELASRDHVRKIFPLVEKLLEKSKCQLDDIAGCAYTKGPGLMGSLLVGASFIKSLAWSMDIPCIGVNHLEAHFLAADLQSKRLNYPFLGLLVSGGHTLLVECYGLGRYTVLGSTLDDAVGECFDKTAKLLGLGYPGGPAISKYAKAGFPKRFNFPKPLAGKQTYDFSFSGLKTHVKQTVEKLEKTQQDICDISRALEDTIVTVIEKRVQRALADKKHHSFVLAGGVAANTKLREKLQEVCANMEVNFYCPEQIFCTDNGAMVAITGAKYLLDNVADDSLAISVLPRWPLDQL